ncbi:hypothetical protein [Puniceibacterium confluentis]|uniref:hypothetical protein n=1 Tax=Puniceibacterium confluentis TaxID=1958944 RepID=UPI0011B4A1E7|nr:hypothetical protein [Puniceibacterium confluentis]
MQKKFLSLATCAVLMLGTIAQAEQIKPLNKANGTVSTQGAPFLIGGLGAAGSAAVIGGVILTVGAVASNVGGGGGGSSAPQTPSQ